MMPYEEKRSYDEELAEQFAREKGLEPRLRKLLDRDGHSLQQQWQELTDGLYYALEKNARLDLIDVLGDFSFNSAFLYKVGECIDKLNEEISIKQSEVAQPAEDIAQYVPNCIFTTLEIQSDMDFVNYLHRFYLAFRGKYNNYVRHISETLKNQDYITLEELLNQHPCKKDFKIDLITQALEIKNPDIINRLLKQKTIGYTDEDIYSLYRTEYFKQAPNDLIDVLINHLSTDRKKSDGIFHKAIFNQYINGKYDDAIKTFDRITKDKSTQTYNIPKEPENQDYNIVVGLYYTGLCYKYLGRIKEACDAFRYIEENVTNSYLIERVKIKERAQKELTILKDEGLIFDIKNIQDKWNDENILLKTSEEKDISALDTLNKNLLDLFQAFSKRITGEWQERINNDNQISINYQKLNDSIKTQLLKFKYIRLKELEPAAALIKAFPNIEAIKKQFLVDTEQTKKYDNALHLINNTLITCDKVCDLLGVNPEPIPDIQEYDDWEKKTEHTVLHRAVSSDNSDTVKLIIDKTNPKDLKDVLQHAENMLAERQSLDSIREFIEQHYPENTGGWPDEIQEWYNNAHTVMSFPNVSDNTNLDVIPPVDESTLLGEPA